MVKQVIQFEIFIPEGIYKKFPFICLALSVFFFIYFDLTGKLYRYDVLLCLLYLLGYSVAVFIIVIYTATHDG